jgi:hypothetical protein
MFEVKLEGVKEIQALLKHLEKKEAAAASRKSTREAQKEVMMPEYKTNALAMVGGQMGQAIAKAIAARAMTNMRRGSYGHKVIIKDDNQFVYYTKGAASDIQKKKLIKGSGKRYFIPAAIEYGHAFPGKGGKKGSPKDVPANPFAQTAYETKRQAVIYTTIKKLQFELNKAIQRLKK